ncbi:SusD/RagB family nutrient-binding outer membrane lipoprotein [Mangrovibacterium lignilyticum]|uniref:SusD/RagB family nutrient-binding outer membrane lipoprotein n=1 Tax=Mangrovibacterium lignilyticum TaxID=2668052 RepID=UPI0013D3A032|nr:SusD/RagB family nutrient-binding outer membrane lipoprotein [Mangrovibacterium lignilyticum]
MSRFLKTKLYMALALVLSLASCSGDFEEINTNPNSPTEVPSTNILAYTIENFTANSFSTSAVCGGALGYANQVGKIQYPEESIYEFREGTFSSYFTTIYRNQQNLAVVMEQAEAEGATNMTAVAKTWSAYIWLIATDSWRDIPFTEALGATEGVLSPSYDEQEDIYPAVMDLLAEANDLFNEGASDDIGSGDLLFGGDTELWQKFANSLRLRMAIRLSNVEPATAKSVVEEIIASPSTYPIISSNDDNAYFHWLGANPYYEPFYSNKDISARDDHGMADVIIDQLKAFNDPRLPIYAHPAAADGEYRGVVVGDDQDNFTMSEISRIGARFRDEADGFSPFMNYAEVCFILAEASANGWATGTTAAEAYEAGITASMEENEVAADDIATYLTQSDIVYSDVDQIYLQKWISLFKNGHEAWAENRRTDVPLLSPAPDGSYSGHNRPPFRQPYPNTEYSLNTANIQTFWSKVDDRLWGQQMYWDTRTGVN